MKQSGPEFISHNSVKSFLDFIMANTVLLEIHSCHSHFQSYWHKVAHILYL